MKLLISKGIWPPLCQKHLEAWAQGSGMQKLVFEDK